MFQTLPVSSDRIVDDTKVWISEKKTWQFWYFNSDNFVYFFNIFYPNGIGLKIYQIMDDTKVWIFENKAWHSWNFNIDNFIFFFTITFTIQMVLAVAKLEPWTLRWWGKYATIVLSWWLQYLCYCMMKMSTLMKQLIYFWFYYIPNVSKVGGHSEK